MKAALLSLPASEGSSTARARETAPTMVATRKSARSWASGVPQVGNCRAITSTISFIRRVAAYDLAARMHYGGQALQEAAKKHELAFVPALDGGYVAMGCATCIPSVFSETIHWGTGSVADQTRLALQGQGLEAKWFDAQLDIDEPEDLQMAVSQGCVPEDWSERYPFNGV